MHHVLQPVMVIPHVEIKTDILCAQNHKDNACTYIKYLSIILK